MYAVKQLLKPGRLSRRKFLGAFSLTCVSFLINPFTFTHASKKEGSLKTGGSSSPITGALKFFSPYQATLVDETASLVIPTDRHPGAREAGVVYELDRLAAASVHKQRIYVKWIKWMDYASEKLYGKKSFLDLLESEKGKVLKAAEDGSLPDMKTLKKSSKKRKGRAVRKSFRMIRSDIFEIFYSSSEGWEVTGYAGPPQWSGNRDYYKCYSDNEKG
jgi:hypothetical protein